MELGLTGKRAVVCASSKGLGFAAAQALAAEGAAVVVNGRSEETVAAAAERLKAAGGIVADVGTAEDCERLMAQAVRLMGGVDILINNSGGPPFGKFADLSEDQWRQGIDATLMSFVRCVRLALPAMVERGWGRIVSITSTSVREPIPSLTISNTLRPGIVGLSSDLAREYARHGITINCVAPGPFDTERQTSLQRRRAEAAGRPIEEMMAEAKSQVPMGRHGDPAELGAVIAFLCSEAAAFVTGETILVDGGFVRGRG